MTTPPVLRPALRVVLVRPWTDATVGGGCCGGPVSDGVCLEPADLGWDVGSHASVAGEQLAETWRRLRAELPEVDVQVVGSGNTAYLLPTVFGAVRPRRGVRAALHAVSQATTAGAVLIEGERIGLLEDLGPDEVVEEVRRRLLLRT